MTWLSSVLSLTHLIGLALGVGAATVKLALLRRCNADHATVSAYIKVAKPITRQIVLGTILLTLSGIGWLLLGYQITTLLIVKIVLVASIWVMGPLIDNVVEPKFARLAPTAGETPSPEFLRIQEQFLALEAVATSLFYVIILVWVLA